MSDRLIEIAEDSARGGFFLFTGNVLSTSILAIGSIIIARLLGPENYGLLALSLVVPSILTGLIDFGVGSALTRFSVKLRAEGKTQLAAGILKSGLLFRLVLGLAMFALCFTLSDVFAIYILNRPGMGFLVKVASSLILLQTIYSTLSSGFMGLDKMEGNALIMNAQSFAKTVLSPLLVVLGFGVFGALVGHVASYMTAVLVGGLLFSKCYKGLGKPMNNSLRSSLRPMLRYGFPLYFSSLLALVLGQYQSIILAFFTSNVEIGNFSIATNLSSLVNLLIFPLGVLFPAFSRANPNGNELKRAFRLSVKYAALLSVPATLVVAILSRDLVYTLYGHSYDLAPFFLSLYILVFFFTGLGYIVLGHLFNGIGETRVVLNWNLVNLLVFVPLAPVLIMLFRVPGLIIAFLASTLLSLVYGLYVATRRLGVTLDVNASLRIYLASLLSSIPTLAFLYVSFFGSLVNVVVGGSIFLLTYLTLLPFVGAIHERDLENFKDIFGRLRVVWPLIRLGLVYEGKILHLRSLLLSFPVGASRS